MFVPGNNKLCHAFPPETSRAEMEFHVSSTKMEVWGYDPLFPIWVYLKMGYTPVLKRENDDKLHI